MGEIVQLRKRARHDLLPVFQRVGNRHEQATSVSRALVNAIEHLDIRNLARVVELRADKRSSAPPTEAALSFATAAAAIVYPFDSGTEYTQPVGIMASRRFARTEHAGILNAVASAAGRELALALTLHDRLPVEVYRSLVHCWQAAFPGLVDETALSGVGINPVTPQEIQMATATRERAQAAAGKGKPRTSSSRTVKPTAAPAKKQSGAPRTPSAANPQLDAAVLSVLKKHAPEGLGASAILKEVKDVAGATWGTVDGACKRGIAQGVVERTSDKPLRYGWKKGSRMPSASASVEPAAKTGIERAAEAVSSDEQPKRKRSSSKSANGVAAAAPSTGGRGSQRPMPEPTTQPTEFEEGSPYAAQDVTPNSEEQPEPPPAEQPVEPEPEPEGEPEPDPSSAAADDLGTAN